MKQFPCLLNPKWKLFNKTILPSSAQDPAPAGLSLAFPHPPTRTSSEIAGNEQNLLFNIGRLTLVEYKSILKFLKKWKTTSMEDNLYGRRLQ